MPTEVVIQYGPGGYDTTKPDNNEVGRVTVDVSQRVVNERDLRDRSRLALAANATYLAIASPTVAQNTAQVKRLTREVNGLLRILLDDLDDVSDT